MAVYKHNEQPNAFVAFFRKIYNPIGFTKGYNFILFFIFAGALFGFALARTPYMNVNGYFMSRAGPGEAYWYRQTYYNVGIQIHLLCIIPACLLVVWQFVPAIRYKALLFHRINGYLVVLLLIVSNVGAMLIVRHAFGGTMAVQTAVGAYAIFTTVGSALAWINIKRLQIEQHRAWMLRTWAVASAIVTMRIFFDVTQKVLSMIGSYYMAISCKQIAGAGGNPERYPSCQADPNGFAAVRAKSIDEAMGPEEVAAVWQISFGAIMWMCAMLHLLGVELYLHLTKAEAERLRQVSYERQLERGWIKAGSAGITSDKLGDEEEWKPRNTNTQPALPAPSARKVEGGEVLSDGSSDLSKPASPLA